MKKTKSYIFLFTIYLICVIPTVYIYLTHGNEEYLAYQKSVSNGNEYKATKQLGESVLFLLIGNSYIFFTLVMICLPKSRIPYLVIIVGTVAVVILYYMRIFGIPILGTDIIIRDLSTDYRDVITKIAQQIMLVPISILLCHRSSKHSS